MDCCAPSIKVEPTKTNCPSCGEKGKSIPLITLKSLLTASFLETIEPDNPYYFCPTSSCKTVYFSSGTHSQTFEEDTLKVPVFQKNSNMNMSVCYCFDWTRERLIQAVRDNQQPIEHIKDQVQSNRCGCEVNNPQGTCCLGNVTAYLRSLN